MSTSGFLISPAEPRLIKTLGVVSDAPEKYGADILWVDSVVGGAVGCQRKEVTDLLNSVADGRLTREMEQLKRCRMSFLVVEGRPHWTVEGFLNDKWLGRWTRTAYRSLLREVQTRGVIVEYTDDEADTVAHVEAMAKWIAKGEHRALDRRPKPGPDQWGTRSNRATQSHFLQSVDGVGPKQADAILDAFGGLPLEWTVTEKELLGVKGIGVKTVKAMVTVIKAREVVV